MRVALMTKYAASRKEPLGEGGEEAAPRSAGDHRTARRVRQGAQARACATWQRRSPRHGRAEDEIVAGGTASAGGDAELARAPAGDGRDAAARSGGAVQGSAADHRRRAVSDIGEALREVRVALFDAAVALPVVRDFIAKVRAVSARVVASVVPGLHDWLLKDSGGRRLESIAVALLRFAGKQISAGWNEVQSRRVNDPTPYDALCKKNGDTQIIGEVKDQPLLLNHLRQLADQMTIHRAGRGYIFTRASWWPSHPDTETDAITKSIRDRSVLASE